MMAQNMMLLRNRPAKSSSPKTLKSQLPASWVFFQTLSLLSVHGVRIPKKNMRFILGSIVPDIDKYLLPIIAGIIFVSFLPTVYHVIKNRECSTKPIGIDVDKKSK